MQFRHRKFCAKMRSREGNTLPNTDQPGGHATFHRTVGPVVVSVAYFVGAQIGFALQSPNAPQSVLWLPNSLLLSVLLVVPFASWPVYLLAAFPAQMLIAWKAGAPPVTLALLFVTNCADAALGAYLVRRASGSDGPFRFDRLSKLALFAALGAALPTILLSFADAGISVGTGWTATFVAPFVTRVRSNILTHLIVVPALVDLFGVNWREVRAARAVEAALLFALLFVACALAFGVATSAETYPALLYGLLPPLLWAAFRFGPGATGWAVLLVALVASWDALHGRGPFTTGAPLDEVVSMQLFLLASAIPLLSLSAVIRERNQATLSVEKNEAMLRRSYARVRELAGKLIAAQELERARIARDMHDDFNQQLAAVSIGISALRQRVNGSANADLTMLLQTLQDRTVALTDQVRHFSHDLHPRMLDHVGLTPALRTHCAQFAGQHGLQVHLAAADDLGALPQDVAICVYRIVQEGLRNVVNHAHTGDAHVSIVRGVDRLDVAIEDRGRGFDPGAAAAHDGLGLLSIEERARLVGGSFAVESAPGRGTRLHVRIPVVSR
jgi:two-component system sensor histidine kinase UhpB